MNSRQANSHSRTVVILHWLMAFLITATFCVGLYMHGLHLSPLKLRLVNWHKWAGVTLFLLVLVRLVRRGAQPTPALPDSMPAWQRSGAHITHALLYLLMLAVPVSGWLMSSAKGFQTVYFGVLPIPDLVARNKALGERLLVLHESLDYTLAVVVALHVGAALKHHLVDRDGVLARIAPAFGRRR